MGKITISLVAVILAIQVYIAVAQTELFRQQTLNAHNDYRARHGVPALQLRASLSTFAQEWADALAAENVMYHRPNNLFGENIFFVSGRNVNGTTPTRDWYNEINLYNFDRSEFSTATGHFTQIVWRDTRYLGVGVTRNSRGVTFVVANYHPRGNTIGLFRDNVPRPIA